MYDEQLLLARSRIDRLLDNVTSSVDLLTTLSSSFKVVRNQTSGFGSRSQEILSGQRKFQRLADDIDENVRYYEYLEPITRKLNAPGAGQLVGEKEFSDILSHLDACILYMEEHPSHRESQSYRSRYRLLLTRALSLVRGRFTTSLREVASDLSRRIADRRLNDTTMSTLLYAKFRVNAPRLKRIGLEIKKRAMRPTPEPGRDPDPEYLGMMAELHQNFAATRGRLIIPLVRKKIAEISIAPSTSKSLTALARSSISHVRSVCLDEYDLWREWFDGDDGLYDFLESICEPLYDALRPRILHETELVKLCELCTLIQTRYTYRDEEEPEVVEADQLDFAALVRPVLEDTQARLVFRTQAIVRQEIEQYRPRPEDLHAVIRKDASAPLPKPGQAPASPRREELASTPVTPMPKTPVVVDRDDDDYLNTKDANYSLESALSSPDWYPTLRKAIWLLSRIYRLVNPAIFDDLAHHIVHHTTASLHQAAAQIKTSTSLVDAQLFLVKHLLALKSQIVAFDIEFVTPEVGLDFSGVTNTFWELRERGGLFNPRDLLRLMGERLLPRVVENMLDAKAELDGRLRTVINDFINAFASRVSVPLAEHDHHKRGGSDAAKVAEAARDAVEREAIHLRTRVGAYLDDVRIRETLIEAVYEVILQNYESFYDAYKKSRHANGKAVSTKGKGRQDGVWEPGVFAEWAGPRFGLGTLAAQHRDEDGNGDDSGVSRAGSV